MHVLKITTVYLIYLCVVGIDGITFSRLLSFKQIHRVFISLEKLNNWLKINRAIKKPMPD